jgi:hypothetical protein
MELEQPGIGAFKLRMRVHGTKAQPHSLHLSAGQVGELAA